MRTSFLKRKETESGGRKELMRLLMMCNVVVFDVVDGSARVEMQLEGGGDGKRCAFVLAI